MLNIDEVIEKLSLHGITVNKIDTINPLFIVKRESHTSTVDKQKLISLLKIMDGTEDDN